MPRLSRRFYAADAQTLAVRLLGQRLVRVLPDGTRLTGLIVETEAYVGVLDRASHAFGGRRTARNESMYARPGTAYVYFTYGMHHCVNIVCGRIDEPVAVLVRALEPIEGLALMRTHRFGANSRDSNTSPMPRADHQLCSGPGKLCQALRIDRALDGADLVEGPSLFLERARARPYRSHLLAKTPRVGIDSAREWAHKPLRWLVGGSPHISARVNLGRNQTTPVDVQRRASNRTARTPKNRET